MQRIKMLTYCAICVALALLLSKMELIPMPQGGAVTPCSMLFIALAGYWFGPAAGLVSGVVLGFLKLALDGYVVHPAQLLLDYPLAFGMLGLAGCFRKMKFGLPIGYFIGVAGRFLMSCLAGALFFASYAPEGQHPFIYSAIYNGSYLSVEALITIIIVSVPAFSKAIDQVGRLAVSNSPHSD